MPADYWVAYAMITKGDHLGVIMSTGRSSIYGCLDEIEEKIGGYTVDCDRENWWAIGLLPWHAGYTNGCTEFCPVYHRGEVVAVLLRKPIQ